MQLVQSQAQQKCWILNAYLNCYLLTISLSLKICKRPLITRANGEENVLYQFSNAARTANDIGDIQIGAEIYSSLFFLHTTQQPPFDTWEILDPWWYRERCFLFQIEWTIKMTNLKVEKKVVVKKEFSSRENGFCGDKFSNHRAWFLH